MEEYVRISHLEKVYGETNLLYSELEFIDSLKKIAKYKELRMRELTLKIALKTAIKELYELLNTFESFLPQSQLTLEKIEKWKEKEQHEENERSNLDLELERIQRKLYILQHSERLS